MPGRRPVLALPVGDPRGIGPEVALRAARARRADARLVLLGPAAVLERSRALVPELAGVVFASLGSPSASDDWPGLDDGGIGVLACEAPDGSAGLAQLYALDRALDLVLAGRADALVTGPTSKEAIVAAGVAFVGQTERCAERAGVDPARVTMLFLGQRLNVAVATRHLALRDVPGELREEPVRRAIEHLSEALVRRGVAAPRLAVCGLNPHAGEGGLFGDDEARVIAPAMRAARVAGTLAGPLPAEAAFRHAAEGRYDGVVAMYHDQATIPSKLLDFGRAANVTWGLPFVRTSVDHGVGLDIAGRGVADAGGMLAAIDVALRLISRPEP